MLFLNTRLYVYCMILVYDELLVILLFVFCDRLKFSEVKYVAAFKEYELELTVEDSAALLASIESRLSSVATYGDFIHPASQCN